MATVEAKPEPTKVLSAAVMDVLDEVAALKDARDVARSEMQKLTAAIEAKGKELGIEWHGNAETMLAAVLESHGKLAGAKAVADAARGIVRQRAPAPPAEEGERKEIYEASSAHDGEGRSYLMLGENPVAECYGHHSPASGKAVSGYGFSRKMAAYLNQTSPEHARIRELEAEVERVQGRRSQEAIDANINRRETLQKLRAANAELAQLRSAQPAQEGRLAKQRARCYQTFAESDGTLSLYVEYATGESFPLVTGLGAVDAERVKQVLEADASKSSVAWDAYEPATPSAPVAKPEPALTASCSECACPLPDKACACPVCEPEKWEACDTKGDDRPVAKPENGETEKLVPVFVKTTDGQPMTADKARELSEYLEAELANDRTTPFTMLLKHMRLRDGHGLRAFAERIGMLPSDFAKIQNGRVEPTAADVAKIIAGLQPTPRVPTGEGGELDRHWKRVRLSGETYLAFCPPRESGFHSYATDEQAEKDAGWINRRAEVESQLSQLKQQAEAWERFEDWQPELEHEPESGMWDARVYLSDDGSKHHGATADRAWQAVMLATDDFAREERARTQAQKSDAQQLDAAEGEGK